MRAVLLLTRLLLLRNKWLILLLMLWPLLIAMVIRFAGAGMNREDIAALLVQESLYGIAMVAFAGSALLGAEERSGRIQVVLARAVPRPAYLLALLLAAWLPLLLYVSGFCAAGLVLDPGHSMRLWGVIGILAVRQLCLGVAVAALSLLASVLLPTALAGVATIVGAAALEYGVLTIKPAAAGLLLASLAGAAVIFAAACWFFARKDLDLSGD